MSENIDHAAEAQKRIDWAHEQQGDEGQFDYSVRDNAILAQANATLALVEQQRIANLIALGQFTVVPGQMPTFRHVVFDMENGEGLSPEIRKALGL